MNTKQVVRQVLDRLADDCSLEEVLYHLYLVQEVEAGLADVQTGKTNLHEDVALQLRRKWTLGAE